jgi:hypothetical protein
VFSVTHKRIDLPYRPRSWQSEVHRHRRRFTIVVCHRRAGKTELALAELAYAALAKPGCTVLYLAPLKMQSRAIIWQRATRLLLPVTASIHESEGRITLTNGSRFLVAGAGDDASHLRGQGFTSIALDEFALMADEVWHGAVRPTLSDTNGEAIFISTPSGKDALYRLQQQTRGDPEWSHFTFPASRTGVLPPEEIESARRSLPPWTFAREYECDADAPMPGAIFGEQMAHARSEGRIHPTIAIEPDLALQAALDIGIADATSLWMFQAMPTEVRLLAYREFLGTSLRDVALASREQGITTLIVPHDIRVRELVSGRSRLEMLQDLGFDVRIAPSVSLEEGIDAANRLLPRCHFDERHAALGIDRLRAYRRNPETEKPIHDESSHGADALRYLALALADSGAVRREPGGVVIPVRHTPQVRLTGSRRTR